MPAAAPESLRLDLIAPVEVRLGEPVPITLRLTNVARRPLEAHFLGREIAFDIVVSREDGGVVWRRLEGAVIPGILQVRTLKPGETIELRDVWRQRTSAGAAVPAGTYVVQAIVPSDDPVPRRSAEVQVRIRATGRN